MVSVYFDESGRSHQENGISVCGVVASAEQWSEFSCDWKSALAKQGIQIFHMTDFAASRGEFSGWHNESERKRDFFSDLIECAAKYVQHAYVYTVDVALWNRVNAVYRLRERYGLPNVLLSLLAISKSKAIADEQNVAAEFIFEIGSEDFGNLSSKAFDAFGVELRQLSKESAAPCQVADLLSWKYRRVWQSAMQEWGRSNRTSESDSVFLQSVESSLDKLESIPHTGFAFTEPVLSDWCVERVDMRRRRSEGQGHAELNPKRS